jgi:hypothetical protein
MRSPLTMVLAKINVLELAQTLVENHYKYNEIRIMIYQSITRRADVLSKMIRMIINALQTSESIPYKSLYSLDHQRHMHHDVFIVVLFQIVHWRTFSRDLA